MRAADQLGDLGGSSDHHRLIMMDHRGTGASSIPRRTAAIGSPPTPKRSGFT
ncbi:hypothetical protein [Stackebrandtia soli]|uniref:hypothetical protein n=1 Tax=Stackebrandtia soli TaxID=1892856 RepID=UPI0039E84F4C